MILSKRTKVHTAIDTVEWTFTGKFVLLLTKICFIPVTVNFNNEEIKFKIWKTVVYLLMFPGLTVLAQYMFMWNLEYVEFGNYAKLSIFEQLSNQLFGICSFNAFIIPILLGHGLQKMKPMNVFKKNLLFPSQYFKIIIGT